MGHSGPGALRKSMVEHYYRQCACCRICYNELVTKWPHARTVKTWIQECNGHRVSSSVPRVLVGNKLRTYLTRSRSLLTLPSSLLMPINMLAVETSAKEIPRRARTWTLFSCAWLASKSPKVPVIQRRGERRRQSEAGHISPTRRVTALVEDAEL